MGHTRGATILHALAAETTSQTENLPDQADSNVAGHVQERSIRVSFRVTAISGTTDPRYRVTFEESWDGTNFNKKEVMFAGNIVDHFAKTVTRTAPRARIQVDLLGTDPNVTYELAENREN